MFECVWERESKWEREFELKSDVKGERVCECVRVCVFEWERESERWPIKEIKNGLLQLVYLAGKAFTIKVVATDVTANGVIGWNK